MADHVAVGRWWGWLRWKPANYFQASLYAVVLGVATAVVWWTVHDHNVGQAVAAGVIFALLNLAARAARIWDRKLSRDE